MPRFQLNGDVAADLLFLALVIAITVHTVIAVSLVFRLFIFFIFFLLDGGRPRRRSRFTGREGAVVALIGMLGGGGDVSVAVVGKRGTSTIGGAENLIPGGRSVFAGIKPHRGYRIGNDGF